MEKKILVGLDRDGTINYNVGYLGRENNWRNQLTLLDKAVDGIITLKSNPQFKVIVATNQAGVARGFFNTQRVEEINREIDKRLRWEGVILDSWQYCPFVTEEYAREKQLDENNPWVRETDLRKPGIGMLRKATEEMGFKLEDFADIYFLGDTESDARTGLNANGKGMLILNGENEEEYLKIKDMMRQHEYRQRIFVADNLLDAAQIIIKNL